MEVGTTAHQGSPAPQKQAPNTLDASPVSHRYLSRRSRNIDALGEAR